MKLQRRDFLKTGGLASGALGLNLLGSLGLPTDILADDHAGKKKMLFIFQRGDLAPGAGARRLDVRQLPRQLIRVG